MCDIKIFRYLIIEWNILAIEEGNDFIKRE